MRSTNSATPTSASIPGPQAGQRRPPHPPGRDLVRYVPERLQAEGFTPGTIDGAMGPQTQQALRWFQNAKDVLADEGMPRQGSGGLGDVSV